MERLTERNKNGLAMAACCGKECEYNYVCEVGGFGECRGMDDIIDRLTDIEDILGEDYDLDQLRKMASQRMTMREDVAERMKLVGGMPIDRLREMVESDREGRCVVLPVKPGGVARFAKNPRAKKETVDAITIYPDGKMSFGFHEYGVKTEWVDRWSEDDADKYVPVEAAEDALKGEQNESV